MAMVVAMVTAMEMEVVSTTDNYTTNAIYMVGVDSRSAMCDDLGPVEIRPG